MKQSHSFSPSPHAYWPYYAYTALWSFQSTSGLWILYLLHCRWTLFDVGMAEGAFHIVSFLANVPTGAFADRFGRRASIITGLSVGSIMPLATFYVAPVSVPWGIMCMALGALSWTFIGGADEALLYNIAVSQGDRRVYSEVYGRAMGLSLASQAAALALGGLLAAGGHWLLPYIATTFSSFLAIPAIWRIKPAKQEKPAGIHTPSLQLGFARTMAQGLRTAKSDRRLGALVLLGAATGTIATTSALFAQAMLKHKGASLLLITGILSAATLLEAACSVAGGRLARRHRRRRFTGQLALYGIALAAIGFFPLAGAASAYLGSAGLDSSITPLYETLLAEASPEAYRATIISLVDTGFSLGMIILFPVAGYALSRGWWVEFYGLGAMIPLGIAGLLLTGAFRTAPGQSSGQGASFPH